MAGHFWPDMPAPESSLTPLPTWPTATTLCLCFPYTAELLKGVIHTCAGQCYGHQPHLAVKRVRKYWKCLIHPRFQKQSTKVNSVSNRILITCYEDNIWIPWWLKGTEPTCQCWRHGFNPWIGKIPWRRKWQSTAVFLPGESHGPEEPGRLQSTRLQRVRHNLLLNH